MVDLEEIPSAVRPDGDAIWNRLREAQERSELEVYAFGGGTGQYVAVFSDGGQIVPLRLAREPGMRFDEELGIVALMEVRKASDSVWPQVVSSHLAG